VITEPPHGFDSVPSVWRDAHDTIERVKQSTTFMPAAVLAGLEALDEDNRIAISEIEARYCKLLPELGASIKSCGAWQPIFHLSQSANIWKLAKGSVEADFGDIPSEGGRAPRPKSRAALVKRADAVIFRPDLFSAIEDSGTRNGVAAMFRETLRQAIGARNHVRSQ
jgi:hypothetical protein